MIPCLLHVGVSLILVSGSMTGNTPHQWIKTIDMDIKKPLHPPNGMQGLCSSGLLAEFSDTCCFTTQAAQVVKFRTTYAAAASNFKFLDFRRVYRECTLDSYTVGNFTHCECFGNASATAFDYNTFEDLDTLTASFDDTYVDTYCVAWFELRQICFQLIFCQLID